MRGMLVAICEDSLQDMEAILDLCERFADEEGYIVQTLMYPNAQKLRADPIARKADILLLDIMMPGENGMEPAGVELARTFRAENFDGAIIFTTTSDDFYPEGFEVGATHYLVKPVSYEALAKGLTRAMQLVKNPERMITVPVNRVNVSIAQGLIHYAEVYGHETMLHTATEDLRVLLPLKRIEDLLDGDPFLRCYRSYIINMDYVQSMEDDHFILQGDVRIPITLRSRQALKERFFSYRLSQMR